MVSYLANGGPGVVYVGVRLYVADHPLFTNTSWTATYIAMMLRSHCLQTNLVDKET